MEIIDFKKLWCQSSEDVSEIQNYWNLRAEEFNNNVFRKEGDQIHSPIIDLLISKGMLKKDMEVLDIGCGPGKYSIEFCKEAKKVTGIDISPKMVQFAKENSKKIGATNVDFMLIPWNEIDLDKQNWTKKYDLVFASNCPGINNSKTLMKMVQASKGFCFISCFANRTDKIKDEFNRVVLGQSVNSRGTNKIYYIFNIHWQSGLYPEICYQDNKWESEWTLEKAIEVCSLQFGKNIEDGTPLKEKAEKYLAKISENGIIKEITSSRLAWIYWKTK
jgi:SAM-dependent methyltransferase